MSKSQEKDEKRGRSLDFETIKIIDIEMGTDIKGLLFGACAKVAEAQKDVEKIVAKREDMYIKIPQEKDEEKRKEDELLAERVSALEESMAKNSKKMNEKFNTLVRMHKDLEEKLAGLRLRTEEVYAEVLVVASYIAMFRMQLQTKSEEMQNTQAKKPANSNANK